MSSYTKWDRAAYVDRVGGEQEAERRRKALMAQQSGYQLAEERKRRGLTQAQLAEVMRVSPGRSTVAARNIYKTSWADVGEALVDLQNDEVMRQAWA